MDLSSHGGEMAIPMPISSKYVGHDTVHHQATANGPPPPTPSPPTSTTDQYHQHSLSYNMSNMAVKKGGGGGVVVVKYRECLKNHAAAIGGNATDGCGEFMPSGEEGSMEALKCSACNCHRNFHRKEVEGEPSPHDYPPSSFPHQYHQFLKGGGGGRSKVVGQKGVLVSSHNSSAADPFGYSPILPLPSPHHHHHHMVMPIGALQTSESDEMEGGGGIVSRPPTARKRFRTKFTQEQKEKMLSFAEKVGWRLQKQEEGVVQQFCQEIGVKRRVLKVWMHNNKHNLAKKNNTTTGGGGGGGTTTTTGIIINNNNSNNPIQMQVQPPDHVPMQTDHV